LNSEVVGREAGDVLASALAGHLGMAGPDGPYVVPVSFAHAAGKIYFHGGEGLKSRLLEQDPRVCLAATLDVRFVQGDGPCADGFHYRSVLVFGQVRLLTDSRDRDSALRSLVVKYDPENAETPFDAEHLGRTLVYVLDVKEVCYREQTS